MQTRTSSQVDAGWIKEQALALGFDSVGIAPATPSAREDFIRQWFAAGRAATMDWLLRHLDAKLDIHHWMPEARSVISLAVSYNFPVDEPPSGDVAAHARIARYARSADYHEVLRTPLHALADRIRQAAPEAITRCAVDSSPLLEREYAAAAGVGWIGKNTLIMHPRLGSYLLLGEVVTSLELQPDLPIGDHCGTCTRCIDACPTNAITAPYQMDPRKCISYLTIEHREPLPKEQAGQLNGWLFGCDICQEVCPYNRKAEPAQMPALAPRLPHHVNLDQIAAMDEETYREYFRKTPVRRVKLPILQANARHLYQSGTNQK